MLAEGIEHHRAGRMAQAEQVYRQILSSTPEDPDALHLLGLIASEHGRHQEAARLIGQAVMVNPRVVSYRTNLGLALSRGGRMPEAIRAYEKALQLAPDHAATLAKLGRALQASGRAEEAVGHLGRALQLDPFNPDTHNALGAAEGALGNLEKAIANFESALRLDPAYEEARANLLGALLALADREAGAGLWERAEDAYRRTLELQTSAAETHYNLAVCLTAQSRPGEARREYERALELNPRHAEALNNLGHLLQAEGETDRALDCYRCALGIRPGYQDARYNLGVTLGNLERHEEAEAAYREVLARNPGHADSHNNLGNLALAENRVSDAIPHYEAAIGWRPDHAEAGWNLALARLTLGDFRRGWEGYERRLGQRNFPKREFDAPRWEGQDPAGKAILLWAEQGLGDTLQFTRYLRLVKGLGARVALECQERLRPLLTCLDGIDFLHARGEPLPGYDYHLPLLSLPRLFQTTPETVPAPAGPWHLPENTLRRWREILSHYSGLKVGLCWGGHPHNFAGRKRSAPLAALARLAKVPGVTLFSLQRGPQAAEWDSIGRTVGIVALEQEDNGILDTAAIVAGLDLVITVDTMMAHLAGSLGRPVWTLLPFAADWRWMLGREDTPWYPAMRLFRQPNTRDWDEVVRRVTQCLDGSR